MKTNTDAGPNWLLRGFVILSIALHLGVVMRLATGNRQEADSYIELEFQARETPETRTLPAPLRRPQSVMPQDPVMTETAAPAPVISTPVTPAPDLPDVAAPQLVAWAPPAEADTGKEVASAPVSTEPETAEDGSADMADRYYRLVLERIEEKKKYPYAARKLKEEGRAMVRFVIEGDGTARDVEIADSSGSRLLDKAALAAVADASPFPAPPGEVFSGPVALEIGVVFRLNGR